MPDLTPEQKVDLAWVNGYRARIEGKPRPAGPAKAVGWDAADSIIRAAGSGGYGRAVT